MNTIKSGQPVLVAALPMPVSGLTLLSDVVERLYGTGESTVSYSGDGLTVFAPRGGFGPRITTPLELPPDEDGQLVSAKTVDDALELTFEQAQQTVGMFAAALAQYFTAAGGINYVTAHVLAPGQDEDEFHVTVQRTDNPSAHDLRLRAEERIAVLERQLRDLGIEPVRA